MRIPFSKEIQLNNFFDDLKLPEDSKVNAASALGSQHVSLPDFPSIYLDDSEELSAFLKQDVCAPDLEIMAPYLWIMSTQSSAKIHSLHHQEVKGRKIIITEDPKLHLVWRHDRIYIKPLPTYLMSHIFWTDYMMADSILGDQQETVVRSALGYLRSYIYLIERPSDFRIAKEHALIPPDTTFEKFAVFAKALSSITDDQVSRRYYYGELRLSRLNFYAKFILRRRYFQRVHKGYGEYMSRFYGPLLFVFTVFSLILNSMQVELAVEQLVEGSEGPSLSQWLAFWAASRYVAVIVLLVVVGIPLVLLNLLLWFQVDELKYALTDRFKRRKSSAEKPRGMGYR